MKKIMLLIFLTISSSAFSQVDILKGYTLFPTIGYDHYTDGHKGLFKIGASIINYEGMPSVYPAVGASIGIGKIGGKTRLIPELDLAVQYRFYNDMSISAGSKLTPYNLAPNIGVGFFLDAVKLNVGYGINIRDNHPVVLKGPYVGISISPITLLVTIVGIRLM